MDKLLLTFGTASTAFLAVYGGFALLEKNASEQAKADISSWLQRLDTRTAAVRNLPSQFNVLFDTVFGEKHLSVKCFLRSCVASILFVIFCLFVMYASGNRVTDLAFATTDVLMVLIFFSLIPDYISLLKTRYVLRLMANISSLAAMILLAILDILSVVVIWSTFAAVFILYIFVSVYIGYLLGFIEGEMLPQSNFEQLYDSFADTIGRALAFPPWSITSPLLYAECFTSLWAILYLVSSLIARLLVRSQPVVKGMLWFFDVKRKPLQSVGCVAGFISAVATYVVAVAL